MLFIANADLLNALVSEFTRPPVTKYGYVKESATGLISPPMVNQLAAASALFHDMVDHAWIFVKQLFRDIFV